MLCKDFEGKKTYTVVFLMVSVVAAHTNGYIDAELYTALRDGLLAVGLATLRAGVSGSKEEVVSETK